MIVSVVKLSMPFFIPVALNSGISDRLCVRSCHAKVQRGNVRIQNLQLINALLYVAGNGCLKTSEEQSVGRSREGLTAIIHMVYHGAVVGFPCLEAEPMMRQMVSCCWKRSSGHRSRNIC